MPHVKILLSIVALSATLDHVLLYGRYRQALFAQVGTDLYKAGYTFEKATFRIVR